MQHISATTMPIIRSSRVLYSGCCLWCFVLWFFKLLVWCGAEGYVSGLQDAGLLASTCFGHHYAHHQELKSIIQWLLPVVFRAVVFQVAGLVWS